MRRRIVTSIVAVTTLAIVLFGGPLAIAIHHLYLTDARTRLEREATLAARDVSAGAVTSGGAISLPTAEGIRIGLYAPDGHRLGGEGPALGGLAVRDAAANSIGSRESDDVLVAAVPIVADATVVAVLRAETPIHSAEHRAHIAWLLMAALGGLVVVFAGTIAFLQANRLTKPLRRVRDDATRLGHGDFSVVVPPAGVPELDALGDAISNTARRLGRAMEREQAFTTNASHQLRTPITGLRVLVETELAAPRPDPTIALTECLAVTDRLQATVDDLFRLARSPRGREQLDVESLVARAGEIWQGPLAALGRELRFEGEHGGAGGGAGGGGDIGVENGAAAGVRASNAAIRQALDVLLDNAVRHGDGTVTVGVARVGGGLVLRVSDEGSGPIGRADDLFRSAPADADGHGIGLGLARALVESEGGRVRLGDDAEASSFEIVLPLDRSGQAR